MSEKYGLAQQAISLCRNVYYVRLYAFFMNIKDWPRCKRPELLLPQFRVFFFVFCKVDDCCAQEGCMVGVWTSVAIRTQPQRSSDTAPPLLSLSLSLHCHCRCPKRQINFKYHKRVYVYIYIYEEELVYMKKKGSCTNLTFRLNFLLLSVAVRAGAMKKCWWHLKVHKQIMWNVCRKEW